MEYRLEEVFDYEAGGHHPVHLGDRLGGNARYKVIHKLGSGGFANVWMARDLESTRLRYEALKILIADATRDDCPELRTIEMKQLKLEEEKGGHSICLAKDHFRTDGPNGVHIFDPGPTLRKIAFQAAQAMSLLHKHGICHGDFTTRNILLRMKFLEGLSEEQIIRILGKPEKVAVKTTTGETPKTLPAPRYLVRATAFSTPEAASYILSAACVIYFGESYQTSSPPKELGIPFYYRPIELQLDNTIGITADLWALGCNLFEIRAGRRLFSAFDDDVDEHLDHVALLLGIFPEPWWMQWEAHKNVFEDEPDVEGRAMKTAEFIARTQNVGRWTKPDCRSIGEMLVEGVYFNSDDLSLYGLQHDISVDEAETSAYLLGKILRYRPE